MRVVATAGHVDHGKSTLVLGLTGVDPDRWAVEKARGLTIDLGFAHLRLPSGAEIAFVDVPGHIRFIKNMLAGVGAVDACLFVVAATEGWKPQSEEHLRILELLGVSNGIVALTKVAGLDGDWVEAAELDVSDHLSGTFLEHAPLVRVDVPVEVGIDSLVDALDDLARRTPVAADLGRPRLWVDRSFAAKGSGTVVTGTLTGGAIAVDDEIQVVGDRTRRARVRSLQSHGLPADRLGPGRRVALNLAGVRHDEIGRGDAVTRPGQWEPTASADVSLLVLRTLGHPVSRRGAYQAYIGSGEHAARLRILGRDSIQPGGTGFARVWLSRPLPLLPGDRFVLRESGRSETVGGGEILDVEPVLPASVAAPDRSVDRVVRERGWVEVDRLARLTGERRSAVVGRWVVDPASLAAAAAAVTDLVATAGPLGLDLAKLDERQRALVATLPEIEVGAGRARLRGAGADLGRHPFVAALAESPFAPPNADGVDRAELRELVRAGLVVERDGLYFSPLALARAAEVVASLLAAEPDGVTVATIRDALGTTRRYLLPLLGLLDSTGVTRRRGERRVGGPRLPARDAG